MTLSRSMSRAGAMALLAAGLVSGPAHAGDNPVFNGVTEAVRDLSLSVPVDGVVREVAVTEGSRVKAGATLIRLDDRLEEYEMQRRRLVRDDQARLEASREKRAILQAMLKTNRQLYQGKGTVSAEEVQQLELSYHDIVGTIRSLENEKERERVEYEIARTDLQRRTLTSPIDGIVTMVGVDVGERVRGEEPVVRVVDPSRCHLIVNMDEAQARRLEPGSTQMVEIRAGGQWLARPAQVVFVSPVADPASGLVRTKFELANPTGEIRPGMPGRIALPPLLPGGPAGDARIGGS